MPYSCVIVWAAPQPPEKATKTDMVIIMIGFRPNISLSFVQIMSIPMWTISHRIAVQLKMLTGVGNQICRNDPTHLTESAKVVGDRHQRGPYNCHLDVDEEHTKRAANSVS